MNRTNIRGILVFLTQIPERRVKTVKMMDGQQEVGAHREPRGLITTSISFTALICTFSGTIHQLHLCFTVIYTLFSSHITDCTVSLSGSFLSAVQSLVLWIDSAVKTNLCHRTCTLIGTRTLLSSNRSSCSLFHFIILITTPAVRIIVQLPCSFWMTSFLTGVSPCWYCTYYRESVFYIFLLLFLSPVGRGELCNSVGLVERKRCPC